MRKVGLGPQSTVTGGLEEEFHADLDLAVGSAQFQTLVATLRRELNWLLSQDVEFDTCVGFVSTRSSGASHCHDVCRWHVLRRWTKIDRNVCRAQPLRDRVRPMVLSLYREIMRGYSSNSDR